MNSRLARKAADLGLIDGIGHLKPMMQSRFGEKVKFRRYDLRRPFWARLSAQIMGDAAHMIEERSAFAQYGL